MIASLASPMTDNDWMTMALAMGRRGQGRTAENPAVGCVIVDASGCLAGMGHTAISGRPHAETVALAMAGAGAKGGTAYVTLEPCAHEGKTPPCTEALIAAGIARCVIAAQDPDKRVDGAGIARLKAAGVSVTTGCMAAQAEDDLAGFLTRLSLYRPHITIKIATSANEMIAQKAGQQSQITGEMARRFVHEQRSRADLILTGIGTVLADNPALTCRAPLAEADSPHALVVDSQLRTPTHSQLVQSAKTRPVLIACDGSAPAARAKALMAEGVEIMIVPSVADGLSLSHLFVKLAERGYGRVFIEAGAGVNHSVLSMRLADEILWLQAPSELPDDGLKAVASAEGLESLLQTHYIKTGTRQLGRDVMSRWS